METQQKTSDHVSGQNKELITEIKGLLGLENMQDQLFFA
jgi:hypothetical protein